MTPQVHGPNSTGKRNPEEEAEALYDYLRDLLPAGAPEVPGEEAALAADLKHLAQEIQADPEFASSLEDKLLSTLNPEPLPASGRPSPVRPTRPAPDRASAARSLRAALFSSGRTLLWAGMALALVLGFSWAMRNLLPQPPAAATVPAVVGNGAETAAPIAASQEPLPAEESVPETAAAEVAAANEYTSDYLPGVTLVLNASFPASPGEVSLYTPAENPVPLTPAAAQEAAAQLGIQGPVYAEDGDDRPDTTYIVTDGKSRVTYYNSLDRFYYVADYAEILSVPLTALPLDQRTAAAEAFLSEHGLLDFAYQVEQSPYSPEVVRFIPLQDELPIRYSVFSSPTIEVQVGASGQVRGVFYTRVRLQDQGSFPVISAEEAWQKVTSAPEGPGVESYNLDLNPPPVQNWLRSYPEGELVDLYGYPEILQPAETGQPPFVTFNHLTVSGNLDAFTSQATLSTFMHVWGKIQPEAGGRQVLQLEGWETSPLPDQFISGKIEREGEIAFLQKQVDPRQQNTPPQSTEDANRRLLLPDLPADAPIGEAVLVRGVVLTNPDPTLEWSLIQTGPGGGGGGGGGGNFMEVNLDGVPDESAFEPTPTPLPAAPALQVGGSVEGIEGTLQVNIFNQTDGSQRQEIMLFVFPTDAYPQLLFTYLDPGANPAGLEGIEALHGLKVRVWGQIADVKAEYTRIAVDRYEEAMPGVRIQAWLGAYETATIEGQEVLLFSAKDGQQYVLSSSIDNHYDATAGLPGADIIIEGIVDPARQFGGYPVIEERGARMAEGLTDLSGYEITSDDPPVIPEKAAQPSGKAIIDRIELVYYTYSLDPGVPDQDVTPVYLQPIWRFSGRYENDLALEIFVQALPDQYLKHWQ